MPIPIPIPIDSGFALSIKDNQTGVGCFNCIGCFSSAPVTIVTYNQRVDGFETAKKKKGFFKRHFGWLCCCCGPSDPTPEEEAEAARNAFLKKVAAYGPTEGSQQAVMLRAAQMAGIITAKDLVALEGKSQKEAHKTIKAKWNATLKNDLTPETFTKLTGFCSDAVVFDWVAHILSHLNVTDQKIVDAFVPKVFAAMHDHNAKIVEARKTASPEQKKKLRRWTSTGRHVIAAMTSLYGATGIDTATKKALGYLKSISALHAHYSPSVSIRKGSAKSRPKPIKGKTIEELLRICSHFSRSGTMPTRVLLARFLNGGTTTSRLTGEEASSSTEGDVTLSSTLDTSEPSPSLATLRLLTVSAANIHKMTMLRQVPKTKLVKST